jgi:hypothetical protein
MAMSERLVLELTDAEYAAVKKAAEASGETPSEWAVARLRDQLPLAPDNGAQGSIPPDIYELLLQMAEDKRKPIEEITAIWLRDLAPKPRPKLSAEEYEAADARLSQHIVHPDQPIGTDNDQIDADLAREYANGLAPMREPFSEGANG